jgi:hypothetical protein
MFRELALLLCSKADVIPHRDARLIRNLERWRRQATGLANGIYLAGTEHSLYAAAVLTGSKRAPAGPWMERGWNARVKLTGHDEVSQYMDIMDLLVEPKPRHAGRTGWPDAIEALACGVPVG